MVTKETAIKIKARALAAVTELSSILYEIDECSDEDREIIRRGIGLSIGRIQTDLLDPIYKQHPEIDDLSN